MNIHLDHRCAACGCRSGEHSDTQRCPPTKSFGNIVPMKWLSTMVDSEVDSYLADYWGTSTTFKPRS